MANVLVNEQYLGDIADSIRAKNGSNQAYYPSEMSGAIDALPTGGSQQYNVLCFTAEEANSTIDVYCNNMLEINLQYSYDNVTWSDWESVEILEMDRLFLGKTLENVGDKIYVRGNNSTMANSNTNYSYFSMTGKIAASGNIQSLLTYECDSLSVPQYCYYFLFRECESLTTPPELPATALSPYCYTNMFNGCKFLTEPPELPSMIAPSRCYQYMFNNCTRLEYAPELPATELEAYCYSYMFSNCKMITTAPDLLAETMPTGCYNNMFVSCSNLSYIKVGATTWNANGSSSWVRNVAESGTFVKPAGTSIATGVNGIPTGWTVINI